MRRLDWLLATVIGLFLVAAAAMQAESVLDAAFRAIQPGGGRLAQTVAADIVRLPVARQFVARYPELLPPH
jgi:hypothetical protein